MTKIYPRTGDLQTVYLNSVVRDPSIEVGDYTIYNDFVNDPCDFERNNVLYRYPVHRERLVATKDVPAYTIVGGVPAREIRKRFDADTIDRLLQLRWWDCPIDKIRENIPHISNGEPDACCSSDIRRYL